MLSRVPSVLAVVLLLSAVLPPASAAGLGCGEIDWTPQARSIAEVPPGGVGVVFAGTLSHHAERPLTLTYLRFDVEGAEVAEDFALHLDGAEVAASTAADDILEFRVSSPLAREGVAVAVTANVTGDAADGDVVDLELAPGGLVADKAPPSRGRNSDQSFGNVVCFGEAVASDAALRVDVRATRLVLVAPAEAVAGDPFDVSIEALDDDGNLDTDASGTVHIEAGPAGDAEPSTLDLVQGRAADALTLFSAGDVALRATRDGLEADRATVTVFAAEPVSLTVEPELSELEPGDTRTFAAVTRDAWGNARAVAAAWSASCGTVDGDGLYVAPTTKGACTISATAADLHGEATIQVTPGALEAVRVEGPDEVPVASTTLYRFVGEDRYGNEIPLDENGTELVAPDAPTTRDVCYAEDGVRDCLRVSVVPGPLADVTVSGPAELEVGRSRDYDVRGFDAYGNPVETDADQLHVTAPETAGPFDVCYAESDVQDCLEVEARPGAPSNLDVDTGDVDRAAGDPTPVEYTASVTDRFGNRLAVDSATDVRWTVAQEAGRFEDNILFPSSEPGTYEVAGWLATDYDVRGTALFTITPPPAAEPVADGPATAEASQNEGEEAPSDFVEDEATGDGQDDPATSADEAVEAPEAVEAVDDPDAGSPVSADESADEGDASDAEAGPDAEPSSDEEEADAPQDAVPTDVPGATDVAEETDESPTDADEAEPEDDAATTPVEAVPEPGVADAESDEGVTERDDEPADAEPAPAANDQEPTASESAEASEGPEPAPPPAEREERPREYEAEPAPADPVEDAVPTDAAAEAEPSAPEDSAPEAEAAEPTPSPTRSGGGGGGGGGGRRSSGGVARAEASPPAAERAETPEGPPKAAPIATEDVGPVQAEVLAASKGYTVRLGTGPAPEDADVVWTFPDGQRIPGAFVEHTLPDEPGTYDIKVAVTSATGHFVDTVPVTLPVPDTPPRVTLACALDEACRSDDLSIEFAPLVEEPNPEDVVAFEWDFGDGKTSRSARPRHDYVDPGRYLVTLELASGGAETRYSSWVEVGIPPPPPPPAESDSPSVVEDDASRAAEGTAESPVGPAAGVLALSVAAWIRRRRA